MLIARWILGILLSLIALRAFRSYAFEVTQVYCGHGGTDARPMIRNPETRMQFLFWAMLIGIAGCAIIANWVYAAVFVLITGLCCWQQRAVVIKQSIATMTEVYLGRGMTVDEARKEAVELTKKLIRRKGRPPSIFFAASKRGESE